MKLKLSTQGDVAILDVLEDVNLEHVSVLRAGITKLLGSGKMKIVLNLSEARQAAPETMLEILKLSGLATGLKGSMALVGQGELVKQALKGFATPPAIRYFSTREAAIGAFAATENKASGAVPPPSAIDRSSPNGELKVALAKLVNENKALKTQLESRNIDEIRRLRFENGVFEQQLLAMQEQLKTLQKDKKYPFEMESMQIKVQQLEVALADFLEKEGLLPKTR